MNISKEDAMQALVAALMFGEDAGLAATTDGGPIYPGAACIVSMTEGARSLLSEAQAMKGLVRPQWKRGGISSYDLAAECGGAKEQS